MTMKVVAIAGGVGSGKSHVAKILAGFLPAVVVDTDFIAKDVVRPGTELHDEIFRKLSVDPSAPEGRARILAEVLPNPERRTWLEGKIFPAVAERVWSERTRLQRKGVRFMLCESALFGDPTLIDRHPSLADFKFLFDAHVFVEADMAVRIKRVVSRNLTEEAARLLIATQTNVFPIRWAGAGHRVDSSGSLGDDALRRCLLEVRDTLDGRTP